MANSVCVIANDEQDVACVLNSLLCCSIKLLFV